MYSVEPSSNTARYIGSTGWRRTKSASSEPAAANVALSTSGIVTHGRPGIELETRLGEHAGAPAGDRVALEHGDLMAAVAQVGGGREPTEPGPTTTMRIVRSRHPRQTPVHEVVGERDQLGRRVAFELDRVEGSDRLGR